MVDALTGGAVGAAWDRLVEAAFDRVVKYYLRDEPLWRDLIDTHPLDQAMPGETVTLTIHQAFGALATTPLTEVVDVSATAATAPNRVTVSLNEFGFAAIDTFRLEQLAYTQPKAELAQLIAMHMADSTDAIVRAVADTSTNALSKHTGVLTLGGLINSILATDVMDRDLATVAVKMLRGNKVLPKMGQFYTGIIHPDVSYDLQAQSSATSWNAPHTVGTDVQAIYTGDVGSFQGARYIETTRTTIVDNTVTAPVDVYNTYYLGQGALVEAVSPAGNPHVVIGPQTDHLRRFNPIGWLSLFGQALYRPESMVIVQSASTLGPLFDRI